MDDYADLAWRVIGQPSIDFGSYDELLNFREDKGCKPFQWFLDNVNPESFVKSLPADVPRLGPIKNANSAKCIDLSNDMPGSGIAQVYTCHGGQNQDFMYFARVKHIMPVRNDEDCLVTSATGGKTDWCHKGQNQWTLKELAGGNVQLRTDNGRCLAEIDSALTLIACNDRDLSQVRSALHPANYTSLAAMELDTLQPA